MPVEWTTDEIAFMDTTGEVVATTTRKLILTAETLNIPSPARGSVYDCS